MACLTFGLPHLVGSFTDGFPQAAHWHGFDAIPCDPSRHSIRFWEADPMFRTFAAASCLSLACAMPLQQAAAQDAVGGGIFGGVVGGLLGGAIGGRGGAVAGAIIGGTTGAAIGAEGQRRREGYYWYRNGCYMQRPDGAYVVVPPDYCAP